MFSTTCLFFRCCQTHSIRCGSESVLKYSIQFLVCHPYSLQVISLFSLGTLPLLYHFTLLSLRWEFISLRLGSGSPSISHHFSPSLGSGSLSIPSHLSFHPVTFSSGLLLSLSIDLTSLLMQAQVSGNFGVYWVRPVPTLVADRERIFIEHVDSNLMPLSSFK